MLRCTRCRVERDESLFTDGKKTFKQCEGCRVNGRARFKRAYAKAPSKVKAGIKRWRKKNPDKHREIRRRNEANWRRRYPEKKAAKNRDWNSRNKGKRTALVRAYQARKAQRVPKWADLDAIKLVYLLARRLRDEGHDVHVDHVVPLKGRNVCGLHVAENLQIVPARYNVRKYNRMKVRR